jgi:hypothetical protein
VKVERVDPNALKIPACILTSTERNPFDGFDKLTAGRLGAGNVLRTTRSTGKILNRR